MASAYGIIVVGMALLACHQIAAAPSPDHFCGPKPTGPPPADDDNPMKTCLAKLSIQPEEAHKIFESNADDKCLAKCILLETKHMSSDGEIMMDSVETDLKKFIPSQYLTQSLNETKACVTQSEPLKKSGKDKETALCEFSIATLRCVGESHAKICKAIKGN